LEKVNFGEFFTDEVINFQRFEKTLIFYVKLNFFGVNLKNRTFLKII